MAVEQTIEKASGSRFVLLTAVLSLAVVSAAAFGRVFQGAHPTLQLIGAAAVAVLLAGAFERRHVLLATLVSGAGLAVTIGLLVFHSTTKYGLPTATTFRAAVKAWHAIGQIAATEVAPTPPFAPLFIAALTAVWAASFSAHALASRARSPLLALLPPAGLLAFTGIILDEGGRPLYVLVFLASAIAVLFADGVRRVGQWGPITVWQGRRRRFGTAATMRGARWVAAVALMVAVLLPGILPGYRSRGLVRVHGTPSTVHVAIDPIVQIRPYLRLSQAIDLFTVQASEATYWRFMTLDKFTGKLWTATNLDAAGGSQVLSGAVRPRVEIDKAEGRVVTQHFRFLRLAQRWLPAASEPVSFTGQAPARYDSESSALVVPGGASTGFAYDVQSLEVLPREKELDAVKELNASGTSQYTQLPADMRHLPEITAIAKRITGDAPNPYRKILALQNYLRSSRNFTYSDRVAGGHGADDILHFLTVSKAGYCEQFAGSMAVLLRSLGIPARVAVGFTPGIVQSQRSHSTILKVTTQQAHAWVEVLFPKYGWLAFEPTPQRFNAQTAVYAFPLPPASTFPQSGTTPEFCQRPLGNGPFAEPCVRRPSAGRSGASSVPRGEPKGPNAPSNPATGSNGPSARAFVWLGVLAGAILIFAGIPAVKMTRRRLMLARAKSPSERVLAAMGVLDEQATDVGLGRGDAETLREYGSRLVGSVQGLDGAMTKLTGLAVRAAYSIDDLSSEQAQEARSAASGAARVIRRSVRVERRILGAYRLRRALLGRWATD
jgi:transglutaminase-like putative cysteine protease